MALFRCLKEEKGNLPDPHGPLARFVPRARAQNWCGFNANRATTKFFPRNSQNYDFHENIVLIIILMTKKAREAISQ